MNFLRSQSASTTAIVTAILVAVLLVTLLGLTAGADVTQNFDTHILLSLRQPGDPALPRGPTWLFAVMRDITALGDTSVLTLVTAIAVGLALTRRRVGVAMFIAATIAMGAIVDTGLKLLFARPRPAVVPHLVEVTSASFPSGHAMNSAVACLTLGALLVCRTPDRGGKAYIAAVAVALTLFIGVSRLYLGAHYPTDVIGGWLAGAAWAAACWLVASRWLAPGFAAVPLPLVAHPAKTRQP